MSTISQACIGEVAGHIHFNVSAGGNETLQMQVFNSCRNTSIGFASFAQLQPVINKTTPRITISPKNGTLAPSQNEFINITVFMPANAIVNSTWSGGAAVIEESNSTGASGASLQSGVAKILTATALPPVAQPLPILMIVVVALVILVVIIIIYYFVMMSKRRGEAKSAPAPVRKKGAPSATRKRTSKRK